MRIGRPLALICSCSLLATSAAIARVPASPDQFVAQPTAAFQPEKLRGICNNIYGKIEDKTDRDNWAFAYERQIYEAAGVDFKHDTAAEARNKIKTMWMQNQSHLRCNRGDFDVTNGSVLKYAVAKRTFDFIDNATSVWGVELNLPDQSDGKTLLDYVEQKVVENAGNDLEPVLITYRDKLVSYGAKRSRELSDTSK